MKYYVDGSYYYTNDNAKFSLRLTQYLPTKNEEDLAFGEHQDYLGFTLLHNDDVPGKNLRFYKVKFQLVLYEKKLTHCLVCRIRSEHQWKMVSCRS
jgi:isopenicillin N synthase-like dioxygenase